MPQIGDFWLKVEFQLSTYLVLELTGNHFRSSEQIYWQYMVILQSLHFSGQKLMHLLRSNIVTPKMFSLKSQFENLPIKHIIHLFAHLYALLNLKSMLIPKIWCMLKYKALQETVFIWRPPCCKKYFIVFVYDEPPILGSKKPQRTQLSNGVGC